MREVGMNYWCLVRNISGSVELGERLKIKQERANKY